MILEFAYFSPNLGKSSFRVEVVVDFLRNLDYHERFTILFVVLLAGLLLWYCWWDAPSRQKRKRKRQLKKQGRHGRPVINSLELDPATQEQLHELLLKHHPPYARRHEPNHQQ